MSWQAFKVWFHRLGSPPHFFRWSRAWIPWLWAIFIALAAWGVWQALFVVPPERYQGDSARILFIHVPAAWQAMLTYFIMAGFAAVALIWRIRLTEILAMVSAPIGAGFTLICLFTGSLWGKPTWGTYWDWDARMTSMLVLLFIYLGIMGLYAAFDDKRKSARVASILVLVGLVNIPIIYFSVNWWNTLHQGATFSLRGGSQLDPVFLPPLLAMAIAVKFFFAAALLMRARAELLEQDKNRAWVREQLTPKSPPPLAGEG